MNAFIAKFRLRSWQPSQTNGWGWFGALCVSSALGFLLVGVAYNISRAGHTGGDWLFWPAQILIYAPIAFRLASEEPTRKERVGLVLVFGLLVYLLRILYSPLQFKFVDELQQWESAKGLLNAGKLFQPNLILPISPLYPGLQIVTAAYNQLSQLNILHSSMVLMAVARLILMAALFLLYEQISGSPRIAGLAILLYTTNPHYQGIAAMYIYQSLAVPLSVMAIWFVAWSHDQSTSRRHAMTILAILLLGAVAVTHHVTSYALAIFLLAWTFTAVFLRIFSKATEPIPWLVTASLIAIITCWIFFVATLTLDYLGPTLLKTVQELIQITTREAPIAATFQPPTNPLPERLLSYGSILLLGGGLLPGLWYIWRNQRRRVLAVTMALGSLGYFAAIALRFSSEGAALTGRSWTFVLMPVGFVIAVGVVAYGRLHDVRMRLAFSALATTVFLGGIAMGWPPYWGRLPGPFMVAAYERSINYQGIVASEWFLEDRGPANRVATDFITYHLLGAYGDQAPDFNIPEAFYPPVYDATVTDYLWQHDTAYIMVDRRISTDKPKMGTYFDDRERSLDTYIVPIPLQSLEKFDFVPNINRIFDSGDIVIYDVRDIVNNR